MNQKQVEATYPEFKLKKMRATLGLTLTLVSGAIFSTLPFYGPAVDSGHRSGFLAYVVWLLPLGFFIVFINAIRAVSFMRNRSVLIRPENARPLQITVFLANFTVRSGRGFAYRLLLSGFPGHVPEKKDLIQPIAEGGTFVYEIGYSEKGGEPVDVITGKKIFGGIRIKPLFRRIQTSAKAYYRPGATAPFFIEADEGFRFWIKD